MKIQFKNPMLIIILTVLIEFTALGQNWSYTTIYTPVDHDNVTALRLLSGDWTSSQKNTIKNATIDQYGSENIDFEGEATWSYNCHGYAWWTTEGNGFVWLNHPGDDAFFAEYIEVSQSEATKVAYTYSDHSAITTSTTDYFSAKWGSGCRWGHDKSIGPYNSSNLHYYVLPYISGSNLVCSSGSEYTIEDLPSGATITWSCSQDITRISSQGSNPCEFETSENETTGWIGATVTYNSVQYELSELEVWLGTPPLYNVSGPDEGYLYNTYYFYASPQRDPLSQAEYEWILNPLLGNDVRPYYDYTDIAFYDAYCCYQVVARAYNTCGYSDYKFTNIEIYEGERMFLLSPNPASEFVTISLSKSASSDLKIAELKNANAHYSIQIFDLYGNLHFSDTRSGNSFTVPVNNLKNGNYFVQINGGKEKFNLKLIVKH